MDNDGFGVKRSAGSQHKRHLSERASEQETNEEKTDKRQKKAKFDSLTLHPHAPAFSCRGVNDLLSLWRRRKDRRHSCEPMVRVQELLLSRGWE